jgi:hypothetical protein
VPRVQWPTIDAEIVGIPDGFLVLLFSLAALLSRIVAIAAQTLQFAEREFIVIAAMRLDVIANRCNRCFAVGGAHRAQRLRHQLMTAAACPRCGVVPLVICTHGSVDPQQTIERRPWLFLSPPSLNDARIFFANPNDVFSRGAGRCQQPNPLGQRMDVLRWQAGTQGTENFVQFGIDVPSVCPAHFSTPTMAAGEFKSAWGS